MGLATDAYGVRWFTFTYLPGGMQCTRGYPSWGGSGCLGDYGDIAALGQWYKAELVTYYQGYWIARIHNSSNGQVADVARILSPSQRIYRATQVGETAYNTSYDPAIMLSVFHYHPRYMNNGSFQEWPGGSQTYFYQQTSGPSAPICEAIYHGVLDLGGDARYWWTGSTSLGAMPRTCSRTPLF